MSAVNLGSEYSQTLGRGLRVLELLRRHPHGLGVNSVAAELGLHRTVVYRLLGTLRAHALVVQDAAGRYRLGLGLVELTSAVGADLRAVAEPWLDSLADEVGATAFLTLADGGDAVSVCARAPRRVRLHVGYRAGVRHPLTVSAAGLAILATGPPAADERDEVRGARERGYAVTHGELQEGAWGLACGLDRDVVPEGASVGVVALTELDTTTVAEATLATTRAITAELRT